MWYNFYYAWISFRWKIWRRKENTSDVKRYIYTYTYTYTYVTISLPPPMSSASSLGHLMQSDMKTHENVRDRHSLVPWPCYAPRHNGQVDFKSIHGTIAPNPLRMRRKSAISCQCSVGVYQDFRTTNHNLNLNYI